MYFWLGMESELISTRGWGQNVKENSLNHALNQNWIPGFDVLLNVNFNHLLFADDLIIITRVSWAAARACKLVLEMYRDLIGQMPNVNKTNVYFPSWVNKKVDGAIMKILGMQVGAFPFKYLGCLISPKKINKTCF